jgi:hypothetical protein
MSAEEEKFLTEHPQLIDHPEITRAAVAAADQHHKRGSESHDMATLQAFEHLTQQQAATPAPEAIVAMQTPTPKFFAPPTPKVPPPATHLHSAPVSREIPNGQPRPETPSQVRLSPDELAIAKASGISASEYAKQKLRMLAGKRTGEVQSA